MSITDVYFTLDNMISRIDQSLRTVGDHLFHSVHFSDGDPFPGTVLDELFPELYAKNGELFHTIFEIPDIIALITKIRYKMAPEIILIGAF